ncbi:DUF6531 domain-containing protein [Neopusillimonas aromaticivorans]|uniref:DUF6531 domain-containing protein n=1 Tax=Neopusillimonas aromaticivorans TaxID=2979868 RepID=UPI00259183B9|nr:DUF6531 domain-containing protein [Neopusillimonas aromaticivorans]WJJ94784.1 DUF6531 domain-containing protein [Neopusillimonas aromaticivorans]
MALLAITRHYSAQNRRVSFMGQGWHSDFDMRLRSRGPETVIEQADGHTVAFRRIGPGLHASSQHGQLHTRTDGWRWQRGHGQLLDFNAQGWLVRVRGPAGHYLVIDRHTAPGPCKAPSKRSARILQGIKSTASLRITERLTMAARLLILSARRQTGHRS